MAVSADITPVFYALDKNDYGFGLVFVNVDGHAVGNYGEYQFGQACVC